MQVVIMTLSPLIVVIVVLPAFSQKRCFIALEITTDNDHLDEQMGDMKHPEDK